MFSSKQWAVYTYWETVQRIAEDAKAAEVCDEQEYIHELVTRSNWVTHYNGARKCLEHTENEDAAFEIGFDASSFDSMAALRTVVAFYAMMADVNDRFSELPDSDDEDEENE